MYNRLQTAGSRIHKLTKLVKDLNAENYKLTTLMYILEGRVLILELNDSFKQEGTPKTNEGTFESPVSELVEI